MVKGIIRSVIVVNIFVTRLQVTGAEGGELYFVDAQSQVDNNISSLAESHISYEKRRCQS